MMSEKSGDNTMNRREFLNTCFRAGALLAVGGVSGIVAGRSIFAEEVWQIDPNLCKQCGRCATECVITPSAVKCVHVYDICGYCDLCSGYFRQGTLTLNTGAENQLCPTSALVRKYVEEPYYQYVVDETKCIGCGRCVKGCSAFGNGSLHLQVRHDRCLDCDDCSIARVCPSRAYKRVPSTQPYLLKKVDSGIQ